MKLPRLNRQLVLEAATRLPDQAGGYVTEWVGVGVHWAAILPGSGREVTGVAVSKSRVPLRIIVRAAQPGSDARPVAGQRLREGMRLFEIQAVTEYDPDAKYLVCHAIEETAA